MFIKHCAGYELEKEQSNTSEDFFNRSEVTYVEDGKEKTLYVLYVRYFDEQVAEITPFEADPVFKTDSREVYVRDLVALACLMKNPDNKNRKRIYVNVIREYAELLKGLNFSKLKEVLESIEQTGKYEVSSESDFVVQPV